MAIYLTVENRVKEKIQEVLVQKINHKLLEIEAAVAPLTPVSKTITGRTKRNKLVIAGKARTRKGHTGGLLKKSWGIIPATIYGELVYGCIYNSAHYVSHVNFGHRTRLGTGRIKSKANGKKFVEGKHFIERALKSIGIDPRIINKNYRG